MKHAAQSLLRVISTFGAVAAVVSLGFMLLLGESITSDDPYIMGVAAGAIVGSALLIALICERVFGKRAAAWVHGAIYGLLLAYLVVVLATASGEAAEGAAIGFVMFGASAPSALLELFLFRRLPLLYFGPVGSALGVATVIMLCVTPIVPNQSFQATPGSGLLLFLAPWPGAPELHRWP